jgi:hypothetical protein
MQKSVDDMDKGGVGDREAARDEPFAMLPVPRIDEMRPLPHIDESLKAIAYALGTLKAGGIGILTN